MKNEKLRQQLTDIHKTIEKVDRVDKEGQALLRDVDGHIRELLARSEDASLRPKSEMTNRLEEAVRYFEVTHPALTKALSELLTTLSNAGI